MVSSSLQMTQADRWLGRALAESHHLSSPPDAFFPTVSMSLLVFMVLVVFYLHSNIMLRVKKKKVKTSKAWKVENADLLGLSWEFSEFPWGRGPLLPRP